MLDAMLDNSMEVLVGQLPLTEHVRDALVKRSGTFSSYLRLAEAFEAGHWSVLDSQIAVIKISSAKLQDFYLNAVKIADLF